jgi:y4mF family transcriptional regulator
MSGDLFPFGVKSLNSAPGHDSFPSMPPKEPDRELLLARFVRERRKANGLTQLDLAKLAGVGRRFVVELEEGKPTLRMDAVNRVLKVFGKRLGVVVNLTDGQAALEVE